MNNHTLQVSINNFLLLKSGIVQIKDVLGNKCDILGLNKGGKSEWKNVELGTDCKVIECIKLFSEFSFGEFTLLTNLYANNNFISTTNIIEIIDRNEKVKTEKFIFPQQFVSHSKNNYNSTFFILKELIVDYTKDYLIIKIPSEEKFHKYLLAATKIKITDISNNSLYRFVKLPKNDFEELKSDSSNNIFNYSYLSGMKELLPAFIDSENFRISLNNNILIYAMLYNSINFELNLKYDLKSSPVTCSLESIKKNSSPYSNFTGYLKIKSSFINLNYSDHDWHPIINFFPVFE